MRFISVNLLVIAFCAYSTIWTASALQCYTCTGQECQVKTFKMKTCTSSTPMSRFTRSSGYQHNKHAETNATSTTPTTTAPTTTTTPTTTTSPTTTTRPTT
ncbi:integumentary mucin C.1-like, partial [Drosophila eugracilis]|uniref:integumentary mucin C.1-like n=1 Tax=Drosophila eugracilis TaxID=29029 RepID=UPI001BDB3B23